MIRWKSIFGLIGATLLVVVTVFLWNEHLVAQDSDANPEAAEPSAAKPEGASGESTSEAAPDGEASETSDGEGEGDEGEKKPEFKLPPPPPPRPPKVPIELVKYRVELPIVFQSSPRMGPAFRQAVLDELAAIADRSIGPMWDLKILKPDWLTPRSGAGVARLTPEFLKGRLTERRLAEVIREQLAAQTEKTETTEESGQTEKTETKFPAETDEPITDEFRAKLRAVLDEPEEEKQDSLLLELVTEVADGQVDPEKVSTAREVISLYVFPPAITVDKIIPIAVELHGTKYVVSGREWDRESELMTDLRSRSTMDRRAVANEIAQLAKELFRPILQIDTADPDSATVRAKASEFPPGDPAFVQVRKGSTFLPLFRYLNRNRVVQKIQFLPWTYLTATEVDRIRSTFRVDTGVKTPLGAFRRRRMEMRAVALKPYLSETTLSLVPRTNYAKPLVGYLVAVYDKHPPPAPKPGEKKPASEGESAEPEPEREEPDISRSDRFGQVTVPVDPDHPMQWVFVRSGSALLVKFPFISGTAPRMYVECPDDTIRLDVEGQVVLMQSELVDTIAKRAMVMAMIKSRSKKSQWEKVDESLKELDELTTIAEFKRQMDLIQYPAIKKAQERKDRLSESRIKKLGGEVLKIARIHLDETKVDEFKDEIHEMKQIEGVAPRGKKKAPGQN